MIIIVNMNKGDIMGESVEDLAVTVCKELFKEDLKYSFRCYWRYWWKEKIKMIDDWLDRKMEEL